MADRKQLTRLKAPYLRRVLIEPSRDTDHFRMMRDFCTDPDGFLAEALYEDEA